MIFIFPEDHTVSISRSIKAEALERVLAVFQAGVRELSIDKMDRSECFKIYFAFRTDRT